MPNDTREPQSYGSEDDWVTGKTGQTVHDPKSAPSPEHRDFYESRRDSERSAPEQGGKVSGMERDAQSVDECVIEGNTPSQKVTTQEGGAKRDSYFKRRDYE